MKIQTDVAQHPVPGGDRHGSAPAARASLRRDMRREDGTFRDSVVFSVLVDEWPAVKAGLQARLED